MAEAKCPLAYHHLGFYLSHCCDQILDSNQIKGRKIWFVLWLAQSISWDDTAEFMEAGAATTPSIAADLEAERGMLVLSSLS